MLQKPELRTSTEEPPGPFNWLDGHRLLFLTLEPFVDSVISLHIRPICCFTYSNQWQNALKITTRMMKKRTVSVQTPVASVLTSFPQFCFFLALILQLVILSFRLYGAHSKWTRGSIPITCAQDEQVWNGGLWAGNRFNSYLLQIWY